MKIDIDRDGCIECGSCEALCPAIFLLPSGEKATIIEKFRRDATPGKGQVGEDLAACAKDAADSCPVTVIVLS
jgi:ferredoxin